LVVWQAASSSGLLSSAVFPSPLDAVRAFATYASSGFIDHTFVADIAATLGRVGVSLALAIATGIPLAIAMGWSPRARSVVGPVVDAYRPIPPLAYFPLLVIWFGIGETSKVILLYLAAVVPILLITSDAVSKVSQTRIDGARSLGATQLSVLTRVVLPSTLPEAITATRVAFGVTYATVVAAELIAAPTGLGSLVFASQERGRTDLTFAVIVVMGLIALGVNYGFSELARRMCPWASFR
jgi:taurine transport system permease protein